MFHSSPARWLAVFPALAALAVMAQPASAAAVAASAPAPATLTYKSALEGYKPFTDGKAITWKEANETVYRRGGWQAYAKEAAGTDSPAAAESPSHKSAGAVAAPGAEPAHSTSMSGMPGMPEKMEKP